MSIKVKIGNLVGSHESGALSHFANAKLPTATRYRLTQTLNDVQNAIREFEVKKRELLAKHTPKNKDGSWKLKKDGTSDLSPEQLKAFHEELRELLNVEVTLRGSVVLRSHQFATTAISTNDQMILEWLIPQEESDEPKPEPNQQLNKNEQKPLTKEELDELLHHEELEEIA